MRRHRSLSETLGLARTSRRSVLKGLAAGALAAPAIVRPAWSKERLVIADPGGVFSQAFDKAFYKPFGTEFGVEVVGVARRGSPAAQVKGIVETKNYIWDVVSMGGDEEKLLVKTGALEALDTSGEHFAAIPADMKSKHWMGIDIIAFVNAYRTDKFPAKGPETFAEFWDVKAFPGRRALRKAPHDTIEVTMRAMGLKGEAIYKLLSTPAGWDQAFKKLDDIKPHIQVWWEGSAQTTQMLATGEVDMCPAWNGRVQAAIDAGAPVKIGWTDAFYTAEGWAIPKGNPKAELARKFVSFCARPDRQAAYTPLLAYGPTNPKAYDHIPPERAKLLPTYPGHFANMTAYNTEFWSEHKAEANRRFSEWLLK